HSVLARGAAESFFVALDQGAAARRTSCARATSWGTDMNTGGKQVRDHIGTGVAALLLLAGVASAEPVHIEFGGAAGAGYSFSRGADCFVLTAAHVVNEDTGTVKAGIIDRAGSRATAAVTILK